MNPIQTKYRYFLQNYISKISYSPKVNSSHKNLVTLIRYTFRNFTMATSVPKCEVLPPPMKSESDKKQYRVIKLENELTACLVSDETPIPESYEYPVFDNESESSVTSESEADGDSEGISDESMDTSLNDEDKIEKPAQKMAAAALCIGVGSFSDPSDVPGMAHFLEHMVFMGSEKYPAENDFDSFIKKGGGSSNASTDAERTTFYFECLETHLPEALDRFSQFFIAPLMKKGAMTREREAIDSEFQMALPSDSSRQEQLLFSLAQPDSPVNSFSWGNLKTLKEDISDEKLYEGVHQFRKKHYSANRMTLAIQARLPLDTLQNLVIDCFSKVPNNRLTKDDFSCFAAEIFNTPAFNKIYYIKPIKELIKVDLTWSLPSLLSKYRSKPIQYVSYLLGDEGKGSLLSYLKKRMWAILAQAGNEESGSEHNSLFAIFNVSLTLTEEGLKHLTDVIEAVFSYINLIKSVGPQRRIFDEIKLISNTSFRFATEDTPVNNVESLCESMHLYPSEDYLAGSELYYDFDPKLIMTVVEQLIPSKLNIMVTTKYLPDGFKFEEVEKWFGTQYTDVAITEPLRNKWENVQPYPELSIPPLNEYLTDNFAILPDTKNPDYPQKLIDSSNCEMWYRKDQKFKLPMAMYYFYLVSTHSTRSPKSFVMLDMYMNLLTFAIAEESYPATIANITHTFNTIEKGLVVKVWGFNEKIPKLIDLIAKYIDNLEKYVDEEMFKGVKETIQKQYYNRLLKPTGLAKDLRLKILIHNYWSPVDRYSELLALTYDDMVTFIQSYKEGLYVKALVQGNVLPDVATETVNKFVRDLNYVPLSKELYPCFVVAQIPLGEKCLLVESFNRNDANSITANYYQIGLFSLKDTAMTDLMMLIIEEPLFDILRTKEQLGYHVYCSPRDTYGVLGFSLSVVSQIDKFSTQHLDARINAFLNYSQKLLKEMKPEDYEEIKEDLIKTKEISDVFLKEEVDRNWSEIVNDEYMFDRIEQEIETIRTVALDELKTWWDKHNHFGNKENYRKITIQIVGHSLDKKKAEVESKSVGNVVGSSVKLNILGDNKDGEKTDYFIKNIDNFRAKLLLYPVRPIK